MPIADKLLILNAMLNCAQIGMKILHGVTRRVFLFFIIFHAISFTRRSQPVVIIGE
jgi:hypothetical protein